MEWIKRNVGFVAVGAASLVLMAVAAWFLVAQMGKNAAADQSLNDLLARREQLSSLPVHPVGTDGTNNIDLVRADQKRLEQFLGQIKAVIPVMPAPSALDNQGFKTRLDQTLFQLTRSATNAGTLVPDGFAFSFESVRGKFQFNSNSIAPLALQLGDVEELVGVLVEAHVTAIDGIRRVPLAIEDQAAAGSTGLLGLSAKTNEFMVSLPYELTFQGFSSDVADVLNRMMRTSSCIVVKSVDVSPAGTAGAMGAFDARAGGGGRYLDSGRGMESRFGRRDSFQNPTLAQPGINPNQPVVVLDSQTLRVTLLVDVVRLLDNSNSR
jgi:hypothetical protein